MLAFAICAALFGLVMMVVLGIKLMNKVNVPMVMANPFRKERERRERENR